MTTWLQDIENSYDLYVTAPILIPAYKVQQLIEEVKKLRKEKEELRVDLKAALVSQNSLDHPDNLAVFITMVLSDKSKADSKVDLLENQIFYYCGDLCEKRPMQEGCEYLYSGNDKSEDF